MGRKKCKKKGKLFKRGVTMNPLTLSLMIGTPWGSDLKGQTRNSDVDDQVKNVLLG
jgi:hypothetical protein